MPGAQSKTWLITGVSSGLGRALAEAALARGDRVAGTVRREADRTRFEALAPERALGALLDVTDQAAIKAVVTSVEERTGGIDILVNNAGYGLVAAIEEARPSEIRAQFDVNVFGAIAMIQAVLPFMRARRKGHIVNITSVSGLATWVGTGIYCASKFALEAIGETLASEVAPLGLKVTNVEPGGLRTDFTGRSLVETDTLIADYEATAHESRRTIAAHRGHEPGDPHKAAAAILTAVDSDDPPLHLLLGSDAMLYAGTKLGALQAELAKWAPLTFSIDCDDQDDT